MPGSLQGRASIKLRKMSNELHKISGGWGCDIVTADDGNFQARRGRIYAIFAREDDTTIESITEDVNGTSTLVTDRSYLSADSSGQEVLLKKEEMIIPDYPVTAIEVGDGSVRVYYAKDAWKHMGSIR